MTGRIAFEAWGNIDPKFILEAAPDSEAVPMGEATSDASEQSPKGHLPHSGWVAAAVCAIVALGVYLGAMWLGQGGWEPPANTGEGTGETVDVPVTDADETTEETLPTDDGLVEPSPTYANKHYVVEEIGGQLYLNFYESKGTYGGMIEPSVSFDDAEDMFLSLYYGELDEEQMKWLASFRKTANGYKTIDLTRLATPVLEEGGSVQEALYYSDYYGYYYHVPSISQTVYMTIQDNTRKEGWAARAVANQGKDTDTREETVIDGMSAVIITEHSWKVVYVSWVDEATGVELYASFDYLTASSYSPDLVSDTVPWDVQVIGTYGDWEYTVNTGFNPKTYKGTFEITKDFLLSFMIQPFDTPRVEPTAVIEKQDYEIVKEEGAWYLTFPEWDGTLSDALAPAEGQSMALPVFASAQAMRETLMGDDMSLYNQIAFKMNADENGRVRIPDLDQMLVHTFPKSSVSKPYITIDPDGFYHGRASYTTDSGHYYSSFGVIPEAEWQEMRGGHIPVAGQNGVLSVNVVEGIYDGLPCTFYKYTQDNPDEPDSGVLCHILPSDDTQGQEYFLTYYEDLYALMWENNCIYAEDLQATYLRAYDISVYGSRNGQYYQFTLSILDVVTAEKLKDFSVTPILP